MIHRGDRDGVGIPTSIGYKDKIQILISVGYE